MKRALSVAIMLLTALMFCGGLQAKTFKLKFATIGTPKDPWGQYIGQLAKEIEKNTSGSVVVTPYYGGKLGSGTDTIKQVARGRIQMGGFQLTDAESVVKELALIGTPFFFDSVKQRDCVFDEHLPGYLDKLFQKKGLKIIEYLFVGTVGVAGKMPIVMPADVRGVKIRSNQSNYAISVWEAAGASTVPLPIVEFPAGLQTGLVKGGDISPVYYVLAGFGKLAPHYTLMDQWSNAGFLLMNLKVWNRLSKDQQRQVMASRGITANFRKKIRGLEGMLLNKFSASGGVVHDMTAAQRKIWQDATAPRISKLVAGVGGDGQELWQLLKKGKASCAR